MEQLLYDPRTKQQIKEALYSFLYDPVQKQFKVRLDTLILRNTLLGGHKHKSFSYRGVDYSCDPTPPPRKRNQLLHALQPEMNQYLKDMKELNEKELPYVLGLINQVLNSSNDLKDYLRLLPESVHRPVQSLIATCPCQAKSLTDEAVKSFIIKNQNAINLMKQRQVLNLIS